MTFIITLFALLMERFFHWQHLRHWKWLNQYNQWLQTRTGAWPAYAILLMNILPLVIIIGLVGCFLSGWLHGLLKLIFGTVVLLYCLGPENIWVQAYRCINALNQEDNQQGLHDVQTMFGVSTAQPQSLHQAFVRALFSAANQRIFAVIFWFAVIGPMGAVLYRLLDIYSTKATPDLAKIAKMSVDILDWIPIRILTFLFALAGNFNDVFAIWKKKVLKDMSVNPVLLTDGGIAALDVARGQIPEDGSAEIETLALLDRAFVIWLVVLAAIVLLI